MFLPPQNVVTAVDEFVSEYNALIESVGYEMFSLAAWVLYKGNEVIINVYCLFYKYMPFSVYITHLSISPVVCTIL